MFLPSRRSFLALAGTAPLAACSGAATSPIAAPTVIPQAPPPTNPQSLAAGSSVADLRFGASPIPPTFPGYDPVGDAKALILSSYVSPATSAVPGSLATGSYAPNERYVIKVPQAWNGKLVVAGTPSFRSEFANDAIWGDFALANGYAFASSNKGLLFNAIVESATATPSPSTFFPIPYDLASLESQKLGFRFGALTQSPRSSIADWNTDFAVLTASAQAFLQQYFGRKPSRTYAVGLSNGGAQVRSLIERFGYLVDGGVDWSGVYWSPTLNILTYLPKFLAAMPAYVAGKFTDANAAAAIVAAGYPPDLTQPGSAAHPSLWFDYYAGASSFYSDLTLFAYALLIDPNASSNTAPAGCTPNATNPLQLPGTCAASGLAVPANRPGYVPSSAAAANVATFAQSGNIQKPLVSIAGADDMFITPGNNATPYLNAVNAAGKGGMYWQYVVQGGTHVDTFAANGYGLQPQLPFAWAAFNELVAIVESGARPAGAGTQRLVLTPNQIA